MKMNLFFDEMAQKLVVNAKSEMYSLKHPYVGSEHLFLAILNNEKLDVTIFLNKYGITYDRFRNELIRVVGVGSKSNEWFLFTPLLKKILTNSCYYSVDDSKMVTPYSLLVAILQEGDGVANRILMGMNIDLENLYDKVLSFKKPVRNIDCEFLSEFAVNLNENVNLENYDPVIGRDDYINKLMQVLLRKNKNNPLLIGEAGVGKTAIVEELARLISIGSVPLKLKNKVIYSISMSSLISGTRYRGEFEEKINKLINEVKANPDIILFIDEIHTVMGAGGAEGAIDAANIIKPYLARGELSIIGATTTVEYDKYLAKDKALDRRFQKIYVEEPTNDEVINILTRLKSIYEKFHNVSISNDILYEIVDLSFSCLFKGKQPDKAIDLLDEVCSYVSMKKNKSDELINKYEEKIRRIEKEKNTKILQHDFKNAILLKDQELKVRNEYNNHLFSNVNKNRVSRVSEEDLYEVVYSKNMIPKKNVFSKKIKVLKKKIKEEVYGQDKVIDSIFNFLLNYDYISIKVPMSLLFVGKSGVGKTFLTDKIIEGLFPNSSIIINMIDYQDFQSISKLIGTAPGYVGYNDQFLLEKIKYNPFFVIVLDNIDRANNKVMQFFYKTIKDGYFYDSHSEKIVVSKCIFIFISRAKVDNVGFVDSGSSYNNYFNFTSVFEFNDVTRDLIYSYIDKKYFDYNIDKDSFINELDYINNGFKNFDLVLKKNINIKS